jgi:predicted acetyltransferase
MMRRQLDDVHSRGEALAALFSSEGAIYGRYGYGPATFAARYVVDKRLCRLLEPAASPAGSGAESTIGSSAENATGSVRLVEPAQAAEAFPAVFAAYTPTRVGEVDRRPGEWSELLGDPAAVGEGHRFYACYEQGGRIDGYAIYRVAGTDPADPWRRGVFLEELCSLSDAAYISLWRYLLGIDLTDELRTYGRPVDEPVRHLFEDQRQFRTASWRDRSWLRLVDVERALAMRRYEEEGTLVIQVHDPFCRWNDGCFAVSIDGDGVASVERGSAKADLALQVEALSSMYLGAVAFTAMAAVGRVAGRAEGAAQRADRMFAARRPPFCTTHF